MLLWRRQAGYLGADSAIEDLLRQWKRWFPLLGAHLNMVAFPLQGQRSLWALFPSHTSQHRCKDICWGQLTRALSIVLCTKLYIPAFCSCLSVSNLPQSQHSKILPDKTISGPHCTRSLKFAALKLSWPAWDGPQSALC